MINIKWDTKYSVDHEKIDNEHRVFIDLIRASSDAIDSRMDVDRVGRQLAELVLYAKFHFLSEENLMIDSHYSGHQRHKEEHSRLLEVLDNKITNYLAHKEDGDALIEFIFEWFVLHSMKTDKLFADYLKEGLNN